MVSTCCNPISSCIDQKCRRNVGATSSTKWPGDDGNWADYDNYIKTLLNDLVSNNMLGGLVIEIWNEPDLTIFWKRSLQQWVDLYVRTHKAIRYDYDPQIHD